MTAYELAVAMTEDPVAFNQEMLLRKHKLDRKIAAAAAKLFELTPEQEAAYYRAIKDLPSSLPGPCKGTMLPVPVHEIGMKAVNGQ